MLLAAVPLFLGAFLLFMLQPLVVQRILPWFGGGASIWITCTFFFQTLLLVGYAYADRLNRLPRRIARLTHCIVLIIAAGMIYQNPILPEPAWKPVLNTNPMLGILGVLTHFTTIPLFILSSTTSLVQTWLAQQKPQFPVHRLFALSNLGSLLALWAYPFVFEPVMTLSQRSHVWGVGFCIYGLCMFMFTVRGCRSQLLAGHSSVMNDLASVLPPTVRTIAQWILYAALSSLFLSATTYHLTQDVAPIPLLWIMPLAIYLLTWIVAFDRPHYYKLWSWDATLVLTLLLLTYLLWNPGTYNNLKMLVISYGWGVFVICYACHGELVQIRPNAPYLSQFYLALAFGGVVGAALAGVVAPLTIGQHKLFVVSLLLVGLTMTCRCFIAAKKAIRSKTAQAKSACIATVLLAMTTCTIAGYQVHRSYFKVDRMRITKNLHNFYASLTVESYRVPGYPQINRLVNGTTSHGYQVYLPEWEQKPVSYYHMESGLGIALTVFHPKGRRLGGVGLGVGTIAAYVGKGESIRFYEINPMVRDVAERDFSYLKGARQRGAQVDIQIGDARLVLDDEVRKGHEPLLDVLVLDAFNSDSIPSHLLTREAWDIYKNRLSPQGIVAVHISHRHINLASVLARMAEYAGWTAWSVDSALSDDEMKKIYSDASDWIIITANPDVVQKLHHFEHTQPVGVDPRVPLWVDEQHSFHCLWRAYPC